MRSAARVAAVLAVSLAAVTAVVSPAAASESAPGSELGLGLWTPVLPTPEKAGGPAGGGAATGAGGATRSPATAPSAVVTETQNAPGPGEMVVAGGLYLSDLSTSSRPTLSPFEGRTELWLTLRNLSKETIDLTADFSVATFYGERIDGARVEVSGLKPEETRVVGTMLQGSGQWPFVIGRATVTPPPTIAGHGTAPVNRAAVVYVFPWLLVIAAVLLVLAVVLLKLSTRVLAAPVVPAASNA